MIGLKNVGLSEPDFQFSLTRSAGITSIRFSKSRTSFNSLSRDQDIMVEKGKKRVVFFQFSLTRSAVPQGTTRRIDLSFNSLSRDQRKMRGRGRKVEGSFNSLSRDQLNLLSNPLLLDLSFNSLSRDQQFYMRRAYPRLSDCLSILSHEISGIRVAFISSSPTPFQFSLTRSALGNSSTRHRIGYSFQFSLTRSVGLVMG